MRAPGLRDAGRLCGQGTARAWLFRWSRRIAPASDFLARDR